MVAEVEVRVILPGRVRQPKGRENRLLAVAREQVQAFKKSVHQRFTGDMPLINRACTDVQRLLRFLAVQKRSIERGQAAIWVFARHVASSGYRLDRLRDLRVLRASSAVGTVQRLVQIPSGSGGRRGIPAQAFEERHALA